jgi:hypothetical protein
MIVAYLSQTENLMSNIWGSDNLSQLGFGYFEVKDSAMRVRVAEWMMKVAWIRQLTWMSTSILCACNHKLLENLLACSLKWMICNWQEFTYFAKKHHTGLDWEFGIEFCKLHIKLGLVNVLGNLGSHDMYKHIICYSWHEIPVLDIGLKGSGGLPQVDNMILYWSQNLWDDCWLVCFKDLVCWSSWEDHVNFFF